MGNLRQSKLKTRQEKGTKEKSKALELQRVKRIAIEIKERRKLKALPLCLLSDQGPLPIWWLMLFHELPLDPSSSNLFSRRNRKRHILFLYSLFSFFKYFM